MTASAPLSRAAKAAKTRAAKRAATALLLAPVQATHLSWLGASASVAHAIRRDQYALDAIANPGPLPAPELVEFLFPDLESAAVPLDVAALDINASRRFLYRTAQGHVQELRRDDLAAEESAHIRRLLNEVTPSGPIQAWKVRAKDADGADLVRVLVGCVEALHRAVPDEYTRERWAQACIDLSHVPIAKQIENFGPDLADRRQEAVSAEERAENRRPALRSA